MPAHIDLHRSHFDETERPLVEMGAIAISTFRYACGIEALRIRNARGEIISNQQISESFENFSAHPHGLTKTWRGNRLNHKFLNINWVVCMCAAI